MALSNIVDKFRIYLQHLENVLADTSKQIDQAVLQRKRRQLVENREISFSYCPVWHTAGSENYKFNPCICNLDSFALARMPTQIDFSYLHQQNGNLHQQKNADPK